MLNNVSSLARPLAASASSSFASASLLKQLPQQTPPASPKAAVFWDSENTNWFSTPGSLLFLSEIKRRVARPISFIRMYEDIGKQNPSFAALQKAGVECSRFSAQGRKEVADHLITSDLFAFAWEHPESTIVLVSRDSDFAYPLHLLAQRGHEIILFSTKFAASSPFLLTSTSTTNFHDIEDIVRIIEGPTREVLKLEAELRKQKRDRVAAEAKRLALEKRDQAARTSPPLREFFEQHKSPLTQAGEPSKSTRSSTRLQPPISTPLSVAKFLNSKTRIKSSATPSEGFLTSEPPAFLSKSIQPNSFEKPRRRTSNPPAPHTPPYISTDPSPLPPTFLALQRTTLDPEPSSGRSSTSLPASQPSALAILWSSTLSTGASDSPPASARLHPLLAPAPPPSDPGLPSPPSPSTAEGVTSSTTITSVLVTPPPFLARQIFFPPDLPSLLLPSPFEAASDSPSIPSTDPHPSDVDNAPSVVSDPQPR